MDYKDILLLVNVTTTDEVYPTLIAYAREHGWRLTIEDRMAPPAGWRGDGALVQAMDWPVISRYVKSLVRRGVPVVNLVNSRIGASLPSCVLDVRAGAGLAAAHFRQCGFVHAAFFSMEWFHGRKLQYRHFAAAWKAEKVQKWIWPLAAAENQKNNRTAMGRWLKGRLAAATKPMAVMCANSYNAVTLLNACVDAGIAVPEDVAIMGDMYEPAFCDNQAVALSGVRYDTRRQALDAAALLDGIVEGRVLSPQSVSIEPDKIVVHQSTDVTATDNPLLRQAFRFIRENMSHSFGAAEMAAHLGVPRIRLDRLFAAELKRSVGAEITRQRIEKAKRLLKETDATLSCVANETGFCNASYFVHAFKKTAGVTPRKWRLTESTETMRRS